MTSSFPSPLDVVAGTTMVFESSGSARPKEDHLIVVSCSLRFEAHSAPTNPLEAFPRSRPPFQSLPFGSQIALMLRRLRFAP